MHSLSPYSLRCFNPQLPGKFEEKYSVLNKIGQSDAYEVIKEYVIANTADFRIVEDSKQVFRFDNNMVFDDANRLIYGWFLAGTYGLKTDIINITTGEVDFEKAQDNAEIIKHFVYFYLPLDFNEGISLLHAYRGNGIKTIFYNSFNEFFHQKTNLTFQMHPLSYEKAFSEWQDANAKEIRLVKFKALNDIADQIKGLGHEEQELKFKPARRGYLGKLKDYFNKDSEQAKAIEILTPLCSQVKTVVELDKKKRTFILGGSAANSLCDIEAPDNLQLVDGNPDYEAMKKWCDDIRKEFAATMYPGMQI